MTDPQENVLIQTNARDVSEVLLQVGQLAEWNPAFLSIGGDPSARTGQRHPIRVLGGLSGHFQYDLIRPDRIESSWQVPGFRETNHWQLHLAADQSTVVTHDFAQSGPLAVLPRRATGRVAERRLDRLKARVEARADPNDRVG
jgi:Polyketide cyclase / dehydrase and lipid transport